MNRENAKKRKEPTVDTPDRSSPPATAQRGSRRWIGVVPWAGAASVAAAQGVVTAFVPQRARLPVTILIMVIAVAAMAVILIRVSRRDGPSELEGPSAEMRRAYRLARRGATSAMIAQLCSIPEALAELVVAEAGAGAHGIADEPEPPA
jgi:hypothetical protein